MTFLPLIKISPIPFASGLSILASDPGIASPQDFKLNTLGPYDDMTPAVSLIPRTPKIGISSDLKYSIELLFIGAAP